MPPRSRRIAITHKSTWIYEKLTSNNRTFYVNFRLSLVINSKAYLISTNDVFSHRKITTREIILWSSQGQPLIGISTWKKYIQVEIASSITIVFCVAEFICEQVPGVVVTRIVVIRKPCSESVKMESPATGLQTDDQKVCIHELRTLLIFDGILFGGWIPTPVKLYLRCIRISIKSTLGVSIHFLRRSNRLHYFDSWRDSSNRISL